MPLPEPKGRQREVLYLPATGHYAVLGTAGSGKTTLAIHRAAHLANERLPHGGRTLLLSFNRPLVAYLNYLGEGKLRNVAIETYHKFARGYLNSRGLMRRNAIASATAREAILADALRSFIPVSPSPILERPLAFFSEEFAWIARCGVTTIEDYATVSRTGRADARVERRFRPAVWDLYESYRTLRDRRGYLYDWDDIASAVCKEFDEDKGDRWYRHVVMDEGQDFSPEMIRSLAKAIPPQGSVTFFGDMAQQIFGRRMSWRSSGLNITKPWEFCDNYRNTRQIARLALAIAKMPYYHGTADLVEPVAPAADGPLPTIVACSSRKSEAKFVAEQAKAIAATQSVAILMRRRADEDEIVPMLPHESIRLHRDMDTWRGGPGIHYGTYHSAKGLEFDAVMLPFLSASYLPDPKEIEDFGEADAAIQDGRLLYVGVTRTRTSLVITHSGPLTELLPRDNALFRRVTA